jgi:hypothetical protein
VGKGFGLVAAGKCLREGGGEGGAMHVPHALCEVAGEDVAKVTRGNDEAWWGGGGVGALQGEVTGEVVGYLGEDSCPVDGVYGGEAVGLVDFWVGEERLDEVLEREGVSWEMPEGRGGGARGRRVGLPDNRQMCRRRRGCGRWHPARLSSEPPVWG